MVVILHIEATSNFLLYTEFVVAFLMPMLTIVQLFDDVLLFVSMIATLMSLVAAIVIGYLMSSKSSLAIAALM